MSPDNEVGRLIVGGRKDKALTIAQLAAKIKVKKSTLERIESGETKTPTPRVLQLLSAELDIPLLDLMKPIYGSQLIVPTLDPAKVEQEFQQSLFESAKQRARVILGAGSGVLAQHVVYAMDFANRSCMKLLNSERNFCKETVGVAINNRQVVTCPECFEQVVIVMTTENAVEDLEFRCTRCNMVLECPDAHETYSVSLYRWIAKREPSARRKPTRKFRLPALLGRSASAQNY